MNFFVFDCVSEGCCKDEKKLRQYNPVTRYQYKEKFQTQNSLVGKGESERVVGDTNSNVYIITNTIKMRRFCFLPLFLSMEREGNFP